MTAETVTYSLESVLKEIKDSIKVNRQKPTLNLEIRPKNEQNSPIIPILAVGESRANAVRPYYVIFSLKTTNLNIILVIVDQFADNLDHFASFWDC
jgi:hypothetical protein